MRSCLTSRLDRWQDGEFVGQRGWRAGGGRGGRPRRETGIRPEFPRSRSPTSSDSGSLHVSRRCVNPLQIFAASSAARTDAGPPLASPAANTLRKGPRGHRRGPVAEVRLPGLARPCCSISTHAQQYVWAACCGERHPRARAGWRAGGLLQLRQAREPAHAVPQRVRHPQHEWRARRSRAFGHLRLGAAVAAPGANEQRRPASALERWLFPGAVLGRQWCAGRHEPTASGGAPRRQWGCSCQPPPLAAADRALLSIRVRPAGGALVQALSSPCCARREETPERRSGRTIGSAACCSRSACSSAQRATASGSCVPAAARGGRARGS